VPARTLAGAHRHAGATENNLAETAFFVTRGAEYDLRWFSPAREIDLCGHATLASAWVLFHPLGLAGDQVTFHSQGGVLTVRREGGRLALDFPARPGAPAPENPAVTRALGAAPREIVASRDLVYVFPDERDVRALRPDLARLGEVDLFAVIATAPGTDSDYVFRFFAPAVGVPEDPATGSAHCTLAPYWAKRLGKPRMFARQLSARGGEMWVEDRGERVIFSGNAVLYLEGAIEA